AEAWRWLGAVTETRRRYVRRITLLRPDAGAVILLTELLDADGYPATHLLAVYLARWQIEQVFQQITEVFSLDHSIGCTPPATVFQASLCLVIYNLTQVLRACAVAASATTLSIDEVSSEKLFADLREELQG